MNTFRQPIYIFLSIFVIGVFCAVLKPDIARAAKHTQIDPCHQYYPNIPGTVLLENDKVVVQRFIFPPGQWEGVHSHPPGQIYIHVKGGEWTVRFGDKIERGHSDAGSVGWYGPVELSANHESVNSGKEPIDLIWVTLKSECAVTE